MAYGFRAAFIILRRYMRKYGCETIRSIISRWAPANENNTKGYIERVSQYVGLDPDEPVDYDDQDLMIDIAEAMSIVENGGKYVDRHDIALGYALAGK